MANVRALRKRLKAIRNIRKITRTMELIATARFKKAMDRATQAAAYTKKIGEIAADLSQAATNFSHPLLETHPDPKHGVLLVLTSNRGLCGGYNSGVMKQTTTRLREIKEQGQTVTLEVSGKRGQTALRYQQIAIDKQFNQFEDKPAFAEINEIADRYIRLYVEKKIDWVNVAYVRFESSARQTAVLETLLPFAGTEPKTAVGGSEVEYEFLPSAQGIIEGIVPAAFKARLFKCFLDAAVSEQIFRMVAMKGATENAGEMISELSRIANRARQAQITSELSEIIGGAEALNH